jgi:hypothetical protein
LCPGETLPPWNSKDKKCCLYKTPYVAAFVREIGDVITRTPPYAQPPTYAPTKTKFCFDLQVTDVFPKRPVSSIRDSYILYIQGSLQAKAVPRKDHFMRLRSPAKSTFKCLILETLL